MDDDLFLSDEGDEIEADEPFWTPRRVIYTLIILITLIAFVTYVLSATLTSLGPSPYQTPAPTLPRQQAWIIPLEHIL